MKQNENLKKRDDITLKELIQTLLDYRWLVLVITTAFVVIAGVYSYVIVDPVYESEVVLNAAPIGGGSGLNENIESIVNNAGLYPTGNINTYIEQLQSPQLLLRVIDEMNLTYEDGTAMSVSSLQGMISINNIEGTNLLEILITSVEANEAMNIANTLAEEFIELIDEAGREQSMAISKKIEEQLAIEEGNLAVKSQALAEFMSESISISELKSEINSLVSQLTNIKSTLHGLEVSIQSGESRMISIAPELKDTDIMFDGLEITSSGSVEISNADVASLDESSLASNLVAIEYVQLQNSYIRDRAQYDAYTDKLLELESDLIIKQTKLVEEEYKYEQLNREVQLAKQTYVAYQNRHKEAIVATAAEIGSNNIVISSKAVLPEGPTGPNKMMNLIIGFVFGGLFSVLIAVFHSYWKSV